MRTASRIPEHRHDALFDALRDRVLDEVRLFVRIGPLAEAGRAAEVYFSEQAEAGDPRFIAKIADTKLWLQSAPGTFHFE